MKHIISTITLALTALGASSQSQIVPQVNRDTPRQRTVSYNSADLAVAGNATESLYFQSLDGAWQCKTVADGTQPEEAIGTEEGWNSVQVPMKSAIEGGTVIMRRSYKRPFAWVDRIIFVRLASISAPYDLYINGTLCGSNASPRTAAEFDITKLSQQGNNTIAIVIHPSHPATKLNVPTRGVMVGGQIYVTAQPYIRIRDFVVQATPSGMAGLLSLGVIVKSHRLNPKEVEVYCELFDPKGEKIFTARREARFEMKLEDTVRFFNNIPQIAPWSFETPNLYRVAIKIQHEGRYGEYQNFAIGFRDVAFEGNSFIINGFKAELSIKDFSATEGYEGTKRALERLKSEGYNTIRLTTPQPDWLYSLCDVVGIFAAPAADIESSMGGNIAINPANDPLYEALTNDRIMAMYNTTKSHPSVIFFSLGGDNTPNGYNIKKGYLSLRSTQEERPISFTGARNSWNNDLDLRRYSQSIAPGKLISYTQPDATGTMTIENSSTLTPLRGATYKIWADKTRRRLLLSGTLDVNLSPGNRSTVQLPLGKLKLKPTNIVEVQ